MNIVILQFKDSEEIEVRVTDDILELWTNGDMKRSLAKYAKIVKVIRVYLE
jgi:hypothetical protein